MTFLGRKEPKNSKNWLFQRRMPLVNTSGVKKKYAECAKWTLGEVFSQFVGRFWQEIWFLFMGRKVVFPGSRRRRPVAAVAVAFFLLVQPMWTCVRRIYPQNAHVSLRYDPYARTSMGGAACFELNLIANRTSKRPNPKRSFLRPPTGNTGNQRNCSHFTATKLSYASQV